MNHYLNPRQGLSEHISISVSARSIQAPWRSITPIRHLAPSEKCRDGLPRHLKGARNDALLSEAGT